MDIRLIAPEEASACNEFHNLVYGKRRTLVQWKWEFAVQMFQKSTLPFAVVIDQGRIVGTQAFIPIRMIDGDGVFWTVKSEETLVDPAYRGQKLFEKMYHLLFEYFRQNKFTCIWGFTQATKAFQKLGFTTPKTTAQLFFPFSGHSVSSIIDSQLINKKKHCYDRFQAWVYRSAGIAAATYSSFRYWAMKQKIRTFDLDVEVGYMQAPSSEAGGVCERFIAQWGGTTIYRDTSYLQWRFYDNPYVKATVKGAYSNSRLQGWVVYALGDDGIGYLVDIVVAPEFGARAAIETIAVSLIREAVRDLRAMGALCVRGWHVSNHPFDRLVARLAVGLGFHKIAKGHPVVMYVNPEGDHFEMLSSIDNWYITRAFTEGTMG